MPTLPFDPSPGDGSKLAFGHYHSQFPLSFDGKPASEDYYARQYLTVNGEKSEQYPQGKHAAYGGFLRDRPLPSPNLEVWKQGRTAGEVADCRTEIEQARGFGLNGFWYDLLSLAPTSDHVRRQRAMAKACEESGFLFAPQPDLFVASVRDASAAALAKHVVDLAKTAGWRIDGRLVVAPFKGEAWSNAKYLSFKDEVRKLDGQYPFLILDLVDWPGKFTTYTAADGFSVWGDRTAGARARMADAGRQVKTLGKMWVAPVAVQDYRPSSGKFWESEGTRALEATAQAAMDSQADHVLVPTWNDYGENSHVAPSANHGDAFGTVLAYLLTMWRTGKPPRITHRATVVTSRTHPVAAQPTTAMTLAQSAGGAPVDIVETLEFDPLAQQVNRSTKPLPATARPVVQDLSYHSTVTVEPSDPRVSELEAENARLREDNAGLQVRLNEADQRATEYAGRLRNIHALSDI